MGVVVFYLVAGLMYAVAALPWFAIYGLSNFLRFVLFRLIGYRRKVVLRNLRNAFPEKNDTEIKRIEWGFYRHLVDLMLETVAQLTRSSKALTRKVEFDPQSLQLLRSYGAQSRDAVAVLGHFGNWELAGCSFAEFVPGAKLQVLYSPLSNKRWDRFLYHNIRDGHGFGMIHKKEVSQRIPELLGKGSMFCFIADQAASPERAYWTTFLNQETAVFRGAEHYARKHNLPILFVSMRKPRRGRYVVYCTEVVPDVNALPLGEPTEIFVRALEADIRQQPEIWLWSHKRWKHRRPEGMPLRHFPPPSEAENTH